MKLLARSWIAVLMAVAVLASLTAASGTSLAGQGEGPKPDIFTPGPANTNNSGGGSKPGPQEPFGADKGRHHELVGMRTRESNTFLNGDGTLDTDIYTGAVNFKDAQGRFQPIDNTLVADAAGAEFRNRANDYTVHLPRNMGAAPTRIDKDGHWLSFSLDGAQGEASVHGAKATYQGVMPGVDAEISAGNEQVKENLLLSSSDAPSEFVYALRTSPRLTSALTEAGDVVFSDDAGETVFTIPAPVVYDSAEPDEVFATGLAWELATAPGANSTLTLSLSREWLEDPARVFPVVVDPTVQTTVVQRDCTIKSSVTSGTLCGDQTLEVGTTAQPGMGGGMNYTRRRTLLRFDMAALPQRIQVLNAEIGLWLIGPSGSGNSRVVLREMTQGWTTNANWQSPDNTSTQWTAGGGGTYDADGDPYGYAGPETANLNPTYGYKYWWYPTNLVDRWIGKPGENHGLMLKPSDDNVDQLLQFHSAEGSYSMTGSPQMAPRLTVNYDAKGLGQLKSFSYENMSLTDRMDVSANVGSGNLLLHAQDFSIKGTGLDLSVDRYFNNLVETTGLPGSGTLGNGWNLSVGSDVGLKIHADGSATYFGPSGYRLPFVKTALDATGFKHPPGVDATLTKSGSTYVMRMHKSLEKFTFSDTGYLLSHSDNNGHTISFEYNMGNNLWRITDTQGRVTLFDYASGRLSQITDPVGRTYKYAYTGNNLTSYTNPQNFTTTYEYDSRNELTKVTDALGNQTTFTYGWTGIGAGQQIPPGPRRVASWTRITNVSNGTGDKTTFSYGSPDPNDGQVDACCETIVRDARTSATQPSSMAYATKYASTYEGLVTRVLDAEGQKTSKTYNSMSNVLSYTNAKNGQFSFTYDDTGEDVMSVLAPQESNGSQTVNGAAGETRYGITDDEELKHLPTCTIDAQGNQTYFDYFRTPDALKGELAAVYQGAEGNLGGSGKEDDCKTLPTTYTSKTSYTYTTSVDGVPAGLLKTVTDARGNDTAGDPNDGITQYTYFTNGNLQKVDYPPGDGGAAALDVTYTYDSLGRVATMKDAKNNTFTYGYDALDRLTQITYPNGSTVVNVYDRNGNQTDRKETSNVTTVWTYNSKNEVTRRTNPDASFSTFAYDAVGNLTSTTDSRLPGGQQTTTYVYDAVNNLDKLFEPDRGSAPITFVQNQLNQRKETTYPNGVKWTRTYNNAGQITSDVAVKQSDSSTLMNVTYGYFDPNGKSTGLVQTTTDTIHTPPVDTTYTYDKLNRLKRSLIKEKSNGNTFDEFVYDYDKNGNMISRTRGTGATRKYFYNQANQITCSHTAAATDCNTSDASKYTIGWDLNGNMANINSGAGTWSYNSTASTDHTTSYVQGSVTTGMSYFGDDQTERTVKGSTSYTYDLLGLATEKNTNGVRTHFTKDDEAKYLGMRVATDSSNSSFNHYYYLADQLGSVMAVTNDSGNKVGTANNGLYRYDPYGNQLVDPLSGSGVNNPIRWASGYWDPETGFYKFGTRYYSPGIAARWSQPDPESGEISNPMSLNPYLYVESNPVNKVDLSGRAATCAEETIGFLISGGLTALAVLFPAESALVAGLEIIGGGVTTGLSLQGLIQCGIGNDIV